MSRLVPQPLILLACEPQHELVPRSKQKASEFFLLSHALFCVGYMCFTNILNLQSENV